jgi:hypothetical protein
VEPDYLPDSEILILKPCFGSQYSTGGCGGACPPSTVVRGVQGGAATMLWSPPLAGVSGAAPPKPKMGCFGQWFRTLVLVRGFVGPCISADGFGHCNNLYILYHGLECIVS